MDPMGIIYLHKSSTRNIQKYHQKTNNMLKSDPNVVLDYCSIFSEVTVVIGVWLVVWNIWIIFPSVGNDHPN